MSDTDGTVQVKSAQISKWHGITLQYGEGVPSRTAHAAAAWAAPGRPWAWPPPLAAGACWRKGCKPPHDSEGGSCLMSMPPLPCWPWGATPQAAAPPCACCQRLQAGQGRQVGAGRPLLG